MEDAMVHVQTVTGTPYTVRHSTVQHCTVDQSIVQSTL
jgi:hypothetical protein